MNGGPVVTPVMKNTVLISCPNCGYMINGRPWRCPKCGGFKNLSKSNKDRKSRQDFRSFIAAVLSKKVA